MKLSRVLLAAAFALPLALSACHEPGHELCEDETVCWLLLGAAVKGAILVAASSQNGGNTVE